MRRAWESDLADVRRNLADSAFPYGIEFQKGEKRTMILQIRLPENLENPILAAVKSGRYASLNDAMADAAILLVQRLEQEQSTRSQEIRETTEPAVAAPKPI